jgi:hypothetical protein
MALGASPSGLTQLALRHGLWPTAIGCIVGLADALALGHLLASFVYGIDVWDRSSLTVALTLPLLAALFIKLSGSQAGCPREPRHHPAYRLNGRPGNAVWQDPLVPVTGSRDLVAALRAVGSPVRYTEYPDVGHDLWTRAYVDPALADWLFDQRRPIR